MELTNLHEIGAVYLRSEGSDFGTAEDIVKGRYHLPPPHIDPKIILDLGAYTGLTARHYANLYPECTVYGAELDYDNFRLAILNTIDYGDRIKIHNVAISRDSLLTTYTKNIHGQNAHKLSVGGTHHVISQSIDGFISMVGLDDSIIDFMKVDIEGAESTAISWPARWPKQVRSLSVELHEDVDKGFIVNNLKHCGYSIKEILGHQSAIFAE